MQVGFFYTLTTAPSEQLILLGRDFGAGGRLHRIERAEARASQACSKMTELQNEMRRLVRSMEALNAQRGNRQLALPALRTR